MFTNSFFFFTYCPHGLVGLTQGRACWFHCRDPGSQQQVYVDSGVHLLEQQEIHPSTGRARSLFIYINNKHLKILANNKDNFQ